MNISSRCWLSESIETGNQTTMADSSSPKQHYFGVRKKHLGCIMGEIDEEVIDMIYIFEDPNHAKTVAYHAAEENNERYWTGYSARDIVEKKTGWVQQTETSDYFYGARAIEVDSKDSSDDWLWGVVTLKDHHLQEIDSLFVCKEKATTRFNEVVKKLKSFGPDPMDDTGDILNVAEGQPYKSEVVEESHLMTRINTDFHESTYWDNELTDRVRKYIKDWSPELDSVVQLVKFPIQREPLPENQSLAWVNSLKDPDANDNVHYGCHDDYKSEVLEKFEEYVRLHPDGPRGEIHLEK